MVPSVFEKENINTLTESSEFLITLFSSFSQAESLRPLFHAGTAQALVREDPGHLPIGVFLDLLRVVVLLGGVAVELLLAVGGHPAVGGAAST